MTNSKKVIGFIKKLFFFITGVILLFSFQSCKKDVLSIGLNSSEKKSFSVSNVFSNNMVIQRDKPFVIWGSSHTGDTVMVHVSWNSTTFSAITDQSGDWQLSIPAAAVDTVPQTITCTDRGSMSFSFNNILIGDVWVCSGQSNMQKTLTILNDPDTAIAAANYPLIRVATIQTNYQSNPAYDMPYNAAWSVCSPATASSYSAVAYYFAKALNTNLNIPVGIIISAAGGTACEQWTSQATINSNSLLENAYNTSLNSQLYNGMIYPLKNLAITGFIWYQGEQNRYDVPVSNYTVLNSAMIGNWRSIFGQNALPFYYVQVAPYDVDYSAATNTGGSPHADDYAKFREAQANIRAGVPYTGMVITMDVGDSTNIHPANKAPVGERLALLALKNTYGEAVQCVGPQYVSFTALDRAITVNFIPGTSEGLNTAKNAPLAQYFYAAGPDQVFRRCTAVITGDEITLTAPVVTPLPITAIRYAFTNFPITNLQNSAGLPMEPFRTDTWSN